MNGRHEWQALHGHIEPQHCCERAQHSMHAKKMSPPIAVAHTMQNCASAWQVWLSAAAVESTVHLLQ
jgi:hypothetical protein